MNLKPISKYLKNGSCKWSPCNSPLFKAPLSVTNPQKQPVFSIQEPEIKIPLDPNRSQLIPYLLGPIDLWPTRLNCILQDLFRDTPLDHNVRAQICTQICQIWPNMPNMHIWVHIWARKIWSSGVSLKRSCKMQFRRVDLRSIGPLSQKWWQNPILNVHPHVFIVVNNSGEIYFSKCSHLCIQVVHEVVENLGDVVFI